MRLGPIPLECDYRAEFACLSRERWNTLLTQFSDANLYQTWDYDAVRCGERHISHLVLKQDDEVVAIAQARLAGLPGLRLGAAYVRWGPVWRHTGRRDNTNALRMALRALRNEFVHRRGLFLRIYPLAFERNIDPPSELFAAEHFSPAPADRPQQTILLNLEAPLVDIRKGFDQKWRNCLNHAERNGLMITQGTGDALFEAFIPLYRHLVTRKKFTEPNDIDEFRRIQASLPETCKMQIFLCRENGILTGGAICSAIGNSAIYLFGATNDLGLKNKGAYLIQWHVLQWLKGLGCKYYNLNGINAVNNPGGYHFKAGFAGKSRQELRYLGRFDCLAKGSLAQIVRLALRGLPPLRRLKKLAGSISPRCSRGLNY